MLLIELMEVENMNTDMRNSVENLEDEVENNS